MKKPLLLVMAVVMVGCTGINWIDRVGVYTYEQAVIEYGPADAVENLDDGRKVASWVLSSARNWTDKLVLTFGKDGRLVSGGERRY